MKCKNQASEHPDVEVTWREQSRACPLCNARRLMLRSDLKASNLKATIQQKVIEFEEFSTHLSDLEAKWTLEAAKLKDVIRQKTTDLGRFTARLDEIEAECKQLKRRVGS